MGIASLANDATLYRTVLLGHIIPEVIAFNNMTNDQLVETESKVPVRTNVYETEGHTIHAFNTYDTLSGATIDTEAIENEDRTYIVKEGDHTAKILELNQQATNGVIRAIDKIL